MSWSNSRILIEIIGWAGAISLLIGYYLIQTKKAVHDTGLYVALNIIGSFLLMVNTWYHRAYPSVFTNLVWFLIGGIMWVTTE